MGLLDPTAVIGMISGKVGDESNAEQRLQLAFKLGFPDKLSANLRLVTNFHQTGLFDAHHVERARQRRF